MRLHSLWNKNNYERKDNGVMLRRTKKTIGVCLLVMSMLTLGACSKEEKSSQGVDNKPATDATRVMEEDKEKTTPEENNIGSEDKAQTADKDQTADNKDNRSEQETDTPAKNDTNNEGGSSVAVDDTIPVLDAMELKEEWKNDQVFTLADPAPWNLEELKKVVDVNDPRSVAAYWVWSVNRLTDNYDDGMEMMKYLFADIEVFGTGYTEGGVSGKAGWDSYFNERLTDSSYRWLPRAYFNGGTKENGYKPARPLSLELYYNNTNTETINAQTLDQLGRLNIVYWVQSYAGGNQVNITLSRFDGTNRWYVTSGTSSTALFYQQPATAKAKEIPNDDSTQQEHDAFYR